MAQFIFGTPVRWSSIFAYDERKVKPLTETRNRAAGGHGRVSIKAADIIAGPSKNVTLFWSFFRHLLFLAFHSSPLLHFITYNIHSISGLLALALLLPFTSTPNSKASSQVHWRRTLASLQAKEGSLRPSHSREIPPADIGAFPHSLLLLSVGWPASAAAAFSPYPESCAPPVLPPPSILPTPPAVCSTAMAAGLAAAVGRTATANEKCGQPNNASFPFPQRTIKDEADFAPAIEEWTPKDWQPKQ